MEGNHTAKNIAEKIQIICNTWKIKEKIVSIVTDNASSMIFPPISPVSVYESFTSEL